MKPGDVVSTRTLRVYFETAKAKGYLDYKPPKGEEFAVVFLGSFPVDAPVDGPAELRKLGWQPEEEKNK